MNTKIVESEHGAGRGNHGKFMLCRFDEDEWSRPSRCSTTVSEQLPLLRSVCGWGPDSTWVLDLQTGEGALFRPGGYAQADLDKHAVWVCPMFEPFLEYAWQWVKDGHDLWDLPDVVQLPDAPFAFHGYRRAGHDLRLWRCGEGHLLSFEDEPTECPAPCGSWDFTEVGIFRQVYGATS